MPQMYNFVTYIIEMACVSISLLEFCLYNVIIMLSPVVDNICSKFTSSQWDDMAFCTYYNALL